MAPVEWIQSLEDPRTADYRNIRDADLMGRKGLFMAEGRFVVRTLLTASRFRARSLLVTEPALDSLRDALEIAGKRPGVRSAPPVYVADQPTLNAIAGLDIHRGCLAAGERGNETTVQELLAEQPEGPSMIIALEDLTNHDNVGSVFRNAAAFSAGGVLLGPRCCDPLYRKSIRVSMGGALCVPFARAPSTAELIAALHGEGYTIIALTPADDAIDINELAASDSRPRRVALLLGAEGPGLSSEAMESADVRVRIAIAPRVDSLNIANAAAIAMHRLGPDQFAGTSRESQLE